MPILQAAHVTAQLFLDAFCCAVKGYMRVLRLASTFEDKALHDMHDNIARKAVMRRAAKSCMRREGF